MDDIGPVQLLVAGFGREAKLEGRTLEELERLEAAGTVRVLDLLFIQRDRESGDLLALDAQGEALGAIAGALLGFGFDGESAPAAHAAELDAVASALEPGEAAAFLLIEHVWARGLKRAIREAGGRPIAEGFLSAEALGGVSADLVAVSNAIEEEQAATAA